MAPSETDGSGRSRRGTLSNPETRRRRERSAWMLAGVLFVGLALSWALFASYLFVARPFQRQTTLLDIAGLVYRDGPTVIVGDSISAALPECAGVVNVAVPGMKAAELDQAHAEAVVRARPARVVVMLGINDLRAGLEVASIAASTETFVRRLRSALAETSVLALGVLPIIENPLNGDATNAKIRTLNDGLRRSMPTAGATYADLGGLFGGDRLDPKLTYDGLHLNAAGQQILADSLFAGLAPSPGRAACSRT